MKKAFPILLIASLLANCNSNHISEKQREQIIAELNDIKVLDQKYAFIPPAEMIEKYGHKKAWEIYGHKRDSVGLLNQERIKRLFETYGYLGYKQVGEAASDDFWISIQHADNDVKFQQQILAALKKEIEKGNANKAQYAMLEDRVNVNLNKPQRFGSQVTYNDYGQAIPKIGLSDSVNVDALRADFDLPSTKEYYNDMTTMHFEMNKQMFVEKGITEPKLYE